VTDAGVAALLAAATARGAAYNVRVNVAALDDKSKGESLAHRATQLARKASDIAEHTSSIVEKALAG
jgi:formiminotetrahydrofolate cyclodeaminase